MNRSIIKLLCIVFYGLFCGMAFSSDKHMITAEWESPLPRVVGSDIDLKEIEKIIGKDGQFIFRRDPRPVTCLVDGKPETYESGIIVSAMKMIQAPCEKVRRIVTDCSLVSDIQSQHTNVKILKKQEKHTLYSYNQEYEMGIITLNSDFIIQQTIEEDGSVSTMLHEGDVASQIQRWEFVPLDDERTMLILTFWSAYSTARFAFKMLMAVMAESDLIAPVMFCSMYLEQYSDYIQKKTTEKKTDVAFIQEKINIPLYTELLSENGRRLIESLVRKGAVLIRSYQFVATDSFPEKIPVQTTFDMLNLPVEKAAPIITDIDNYPKAIPIVKAVKRKQGPDREIVNMKYGVGKFPLLIRYFIQQSYETAQKNHLKFQNQGIKGSYSPYYGAYEWDRMKYAGTGNPDATLYIYSHSLKVGPEATFLIRTLNKLMPDSESVQLIFAGTILVETRIRWIEENYR